MYSDFSLDVSLFWDYWERLKAQISGITNMGADLYDLLLGYQRIANRAAAVGREDIVAEAEEGVSKVNSLFVLWNNIKSKIDYFVPQFMKAESEAIKSETSSSGTETVEGFGIVFALPVWAIAMLIGGGMAALTYIITNSPKLLGEASAAREVLRLLENKVISAEEAAKVISAVPERAGFLEKLGTVGTLFALGVGGLFLYGATRK